jgi:hypothetical protein
MDAVLSSVRSAADRLAAAIPDPSSMAPHLQLAAERLGVALPAAPTGVQAAGLLFVALAAVLLALRVLLFAIRVLRFSYVYFLRPGRDLRAYGSWAVVTGATDGIGKAYCHALAKKGTCQARRGPGRRAPVRVLAPVTQPSTVQPAHQRPGHPSLNPPSHPLACCRPEYPARVPHRVPPE